jgi:glycosyltransferase involved in cell wall biosynthesis
VLALVPDAFGGYGGIAQYNRDFLCALTAHPNVSEVVVLPRLVSHELTALPAKLQHVTTGLGGKRRYVAALLRTVLADRSFDVIVCAHVNLLPLACVAQLITGAPIALTLYGIEVWRPPSSLLARLAVSKISAYISISRITEEKFSRWAKLRNVRGHILPNAINLEAYAPGPKDPQLSARYGVSGKRVLMTLGRIASGERYKGFDEVLELLPRLAVQVPDIVYMIAGDGDDRERLVAKAGALGVRDRVIFTGFVAEDEKAALYRLADVYIHPSRGEGFGYVILEALASGIPTIASKVDGGREALRNGELGILVDPTDATEIEQAILASLGKARAVLPGVGYFSYAKFEQRLHRIFDECLGVVAPGTTRLAHQMLETTGIA